MRTKEICQRCGAVYVGTEKSWYCPKCRKDVLRKLAKERNLHQLGLDARRKHKAEAAPKEET